MMALQNYDELKDAVIQWPDLGGEEDLAGYVDVCITLGESRINQILRLQGSIETYTINPISGIYQGLPDDYLEMDRVLGPDGQTLECRPSAEIDTYGCEPDGPAFYSIQGRTIQFAGVTDQVTIHYYAMFEPLSETGTNWLFQFAPGVYLFAALMEAAIFSKESEQEMARYQQNFDRTVAQLMELDSVAKHPRSQPLRAIRSPSGRKARSA